MRMLISFCAVAGALLLSAIPGLAGEWREGTPSTTRQAFSASALFGDEIYIAGGAGISTPQSSFEAYDMIGDIWRSLPALPKGVQQAAMAAVNGRLYLSGGYHAESRGPDNAMFWMFDPSIGFWVQGPDMPGPRAWHQMIGVEGKVYVVGGVGSHPDRVFVFDPGTDSWETLSTRFPAARSALALIVKGGDVIALGGRLTNGAATSRVDILDLGTGKWRSGPALPEPRAGLGATVLDGQVHVVGGEQLSPPRTFSDHYVLDVDGVRWTQAEPLTTPRHGSAVVASGGRLFVVGGASGPGVYTVFTVSDLVSIYQP